MPLFPVGGGLPHFIFGNPFGGTVIGTAGNDWIFGGFGADIIIGLGGSDLMFGGRGNDTFVFDGSVGDDTIMDFRFGHDMLDLAGTEVTADNFADRIEYNASSHMLTIKLGALDGNGDSLSTVTLFGVSQSELDSLLSGADVIFNPGAGDTVLTGTPGVQDIFSIAPGDGAVTIDGFELGVFEVPDDGDILDLTAFGVTRDGLITAADGTAFGMALLQAGVIFGDFILSLDSDFVNNFTNTDTAGTDDDLTIVITETGTGDVVSITLLGVDTLVEIDEALFFHTATGAAVATLASVDAGGDDGLALLGTEPTGVMGHGNGFGPDSFLLDYL